MRQYKHPKYLLQGEKFGRWEIIEADSNSKQKKPNAPSKWKYMCKCICGNVKSISRYSLLSGKSTSCGCFMAEQAKLNRTVRNKIKRVGNTIYIYFYNKQGTLKKEYTKIEETDYHLVKSFCWNLSKNGYVISRYRDSNKTVYLHRLIMGAPEDLEIDHKDTDKLNNLKTNLRIASSFQNKWNKGNTKANTSGLRGVSWHKRNKKWQVQIRVYNQYIALGYYSDFERAKEVRINAEKRYFKKFRYEEDKTV